MTIRWAKFAKSQLNRQYFWYLDKKGLDFALSFEKSIYSTLNSLRIMPEIGRREPQFKRPTRSLLAHPGCRIYYRIGINGDYVYITHLHFTRMTS